MAGLERRLPSGSDVQMFTSDDCFVAVMGITGSGKSTFISLLAGDEDVEVGHSLASCTADVRPYSFIHKDGRRVFILDTPGFDDTRRSDTDILKDVAYYLSQTYKQKIYLNGIIYLHRITDVRMQGSSLKNLNMFKALCGQDVYKNVILATTMWGNLKDPTIGLAREKDLIDNKAWWGLMHERGSNIIRHDGTAASALDIIDRLTQGTPDVVLNIQRELVDDGRDLGTTEAGKAVEQDLQRAKERFQNEKKELEEQHAQALRDRDFALADTLKQQRQEYDNKLQQAAQAQADLRIDLERLEHEKRQEIKNLEANALKQALDLERMQTEQEAELKILREKSQTQQADLLAEMEKIKEQKERADREEGERFNHRMRLIEQKLAEQQQKFQEQEDELSAKVKSTRNKKNVLWKVLMPLVSLGIMVVGIVTGDPGTAISGFGMMHGSGQTT